MPRWWCWARWLAGAPPAVAGSPAPTAYVASFLTDTVTPIDTATGTAGTATTAATNPFGIAITPDQAPVAAFTATPAPAGSATSFDASASTSPGAPIATYAWVFGDGSKTTAEGPDASHTYASAGTYQVTVTVTDADGTATTKVFTGQTVSRNGNPTAKITHPVTISP